MATYRLNVTVAFDYEVEAESLEDAREQGWNYEEYLFHAAVEEIRAELIEEDEDED